MKLVGTWVHQYNTRLSSNCRAGKLSHRKIVTSEICRTWKKCSKLTKRYLIIFYWRNIVIGKICIGYRQFCCMPNIARNTLYCIQFVGVTRRRLGWTRKSTRAPALTLPKVCDSASPHTAESQPLDRPGLPARALKAKDYLSREGRNEK